MNVDISVKLKIGKKELTLTEQEARELYNKLNGIFGYVVYPYYPQPWYPVPYSTGDNPTSSYVTICNNDLIEA